MTEKARRPGTALYLKWTSKGRVPSYQSGTPVPYRKWTDPVAVPALCVQGWHACRWEDAIEHISDELWICELRDPIIEGNDKVVAGSLRLIRKASGINDRTLRLFAADCAEQVLPIFEEQQPNDDRPRKAIQMARDYAEGRITTTAGAAARAAARAAAWAAARDAAWDAAWDAAGDAAADAAAAAARDAARAAARDAVWAAARDAAWDAAADAAWDAARDAAWDAAWAAAKAWQTERLLIHYAQLDPGDFTHRGEGAP